MTLLSLIHHLLVAMQWINSLLSIVITNKN